MSDPEIKFTLNYETAKAIVGLQNMIAENINLNRSFGEIGKTAKETAREYQAFIKNVQKLNETPNDRFAQAQKEHQRTLGMLNRALQEGAINYRTFNNEAEKSAAKTRAADPAVIDRLERHNNLLREGKLLHEARAAAVLQAAQKEAAADAKKAAEFVANRTKERKAWQAFIGEVKQLNTTPVEMFEARMRRLNTAFKAGAIDQQLYNREVARMRDELLKAGSAQDKVSGMDQLLNLAKAAGLYGVITRAVGILKQGFEELKAQMDATVGRSDALLQSRQDLFVASDFNRGKFESGMQIAQGLTKAGINEAEATAAVTMGRQFDVLKDEDVLAAAKLTPATGGNLEDTVRLVGAVKTAYRGQFGGTAGTEKINEIAVAGTTHGAWKPADVPRVMAGSIIQGKRLGASYEELIAAGSVMSEAFPSSADTAGDRLTLLVNRLAENENFRGLGLMGSVARLKNLSRDQYAEFVGDTEGGLGEGLSDEDYHKEVGKRIEMAQAVNALADGFARLGKYRGEMEEVGRKAGTPEGMAATAVPIAMQIPTIGKVISHRSSKEGVEQGREKRDLPYAVGADISYNLAEKALTDAGFSAGEIAMKSFWTKPERGLAWALGRSDTTSPSGNLLINSGDLERSSRMNQANENYQKAMLEETQKQTQALLDIKNKPETKFNRAAAQAQAQLQPN